MYNIVSTRQEGETIWTLVDFNLNGVMVQIDIPHFMPDSKERIIVGIENRAISEQRKLDAIALNKTLMSEL